MTTGRLFIRKLSTEGSKKIAAWSTKKVLGLLGVTAAAGYHLNTQYKFEDKMKSFRYLAEQGRPSLITRILEREYDLTNEQVHEAVAILNENPKTSLDDAVTMALEPPPGYYEARAWRATPEEAKNMTINQRRAFISLKPLYRWQLSAEDIRKLPPSIDETQIILAEKLFKKISLADVIELINSFDAEQAKKIIENKELFDLVVRSKSRDTFRDIFFDHTPFQNRLFAVMMAKDIDQIRNSLDDAVNFRELLNDTVDTSKTIMSYESLTIKIKQDPIMSLFIAEVADNFVHNKWSLKDQTKIKKNMNLLYDLFKPSQKKTVSQNQVSARKLGK